MMKNLTLNNRTIFKIIILILIAVFSMTVLTVKTTGVQNHRHEIEQIDEKIDTVLELTAASTAASAVISLLPDDSATPIADKLADFSSYFLIALCALYLEKYLISMVGYASFQILIPAACLLGIAAIFMKAKFFRNIAVKIGIFALIIYCIIPGSIKISDMIYETYDTQIEETIDTAKDTANLAEESDDSESVADKVFNVIKETASTITEFATDILSNFIEALAVMLVTSCLIPVLVLLGFSWLAKLLFSVPVSDQMVLQLPEKMMSFLPEGPDHNRADRAEGRSYEKPDKHRSEEATAHLPEKPDKHRSEEATAHLPEKPNHHPTEKASGKGTEESDSHLQEAIETQQKYNRHENDPE